MDSRKVDSEVSINRLSKELDLVIRSEKSYSDFDKMFIEVYPDFYNKLNAFASLSQTDLRLASSWRINSFIEVAGLQRFCRPKLGFSGTSVTANHPKGGHLNEKKISSKTDRFFLGVLSIRSISRVIRANDL